jgi:hypothetical protein
VTAISGCFLVVFFFSESLICTLKRYKISFLSVLVENCAIITNSNMTSFFRFVNNWVIYRLGIISLAHTPVHVTDFPVVNVHVDELSSAWIWQHKLCATLSANVNINYRLPIKVYYRICTLRHIKIKINNGKQNVFWVLTWVGR